MKLYLFIFGYKPFFKWYIERRTKDKESGGIVELADQRANKQKKEKKKPPILTW